MMMVSHNRIAPLAGLGLIVCSAGAQAGVSGLLNGRAVAPDSLPDKSVEAGIVIGEYDDADIQYFGARLNFRLSPELMVFGDLGQTELDFGDDIETDGLAFGIGGYYVVDGVFAETDFALRGSFHKTSQELKNNSDLEGDLDVISLEAVFSGREGMGASGNIGWYGNVGIHRIKTGGDFDNDSETEIGFGGGLILPAASGQFYVGVDHVEDLTFGGGFRYFLQ